MASGTELESSQPASGQSLLEKVGPHATKIMIGAAGAGLIALFLPAVVISFLGTSQTAFGAEGWQGKLGFAAYVAVGVMAGQMLRKPYLPSTKSLSLACLITAGVGVLMALWLFIDVGRSSAAVSIPGAGVQVRTGIGAYLNVLASLALAAGALFQAKRAEVF